jgi:hypothetical protein
MYLWLLLVCGSPVGIPSDPVPVVVAEKVDLIEVNHYYDDRGNRVFDQVIYFDWSPEQFRFTARGYRLIKQETQVPVPVAPGAYHSIWSDGDCLRDLRAAVSTETWLQWDPELAERNYLPKSMRVDFAVFSSPQARPPQLATPRSAADVSQGR